jgi:hypothetical protein
MNDEQKGWCGIQITKVLLEGVLEGPNQDKCAQAIGYLVASAIKSSPHQPCMICRIDVVENTK